MTIHVFPQKSGEDFYYSEIEIGKAKVGHLLLTRSELIWLRDTVGAEMNYPRSGVRL